jgi:hypothetical protein
MVLQPNRTGLTEREKTRRFRTRFCNWFWRSALFCNGKSGWGARDRTYNSQHRKPLIVNGLDRKSKRSFANGFALEPQAGLGY